MSLSNLSPPVQRFLSAVQADDGAALRATLGEDAALIDDDREYRGEAVAEWLASLSLRRVGAIRPINEAKHDGVIVLTILTTERNANGQYEEVQRDWRLTIKTDLIVSVRVLRHPIPALPPAVAAYVRATNSFDLGGLLATFVDDALVNDQLRDYWGKQAIREWAEREIIGARLTMYVVDAVEHYGHVIVTANINGEFDRRGLPDPLVLAFYFSAPRDRIVQLIILRNQSGT
jgi:hypothetical protein